VTIFFTSDTHFNHEAVIGFCNRPFSSLDEMNEAMIANWNATVGPGDEVYHLGDFCWFEREAVDFFARLSGVKHLIVGNHDHKKVRRLPWASVQYATKIKHYGATIYLSHYPVIGFRESLHFHGHQHNPTPAQFPKQVDVGVDAWGFRPVSIMDAVGAAIPARAEAMP
jgi:calcineurin-like phosphoesterase family protein